MADVKQDETKPATSPAKTDPAAPEKAEPKPAVWDPFAAMRGEIDRVFDQFGRGAFGVGLLGDWTQAGARFAESLTGALMPSVDMHETEAAVTVTVELPGISEKDVTVSVGDGLLTVKGEKRTESGSGGGEKQAHVVERRFGSFQRAFRLPPTVDQEKIAASFDKGVLKIVAPKTATPPKTERTIQIKSS